MSLRSRIQQAVEKIASDIDVAIEVPQRSLHGDFATNAAFLLAPKGKAPKKTAEDLIQKMDTDLFENVTVAGAGFINFFLKKEILHKELADILAQKDSYGKGETKKDKIQVEFISANPTGPITLGNGRGAFLGDALANVLRRAGYETKTEYYVNDAKASKQITDLGKSILGEGSSYPYVEEMYLKENQKLKKEVGGMNAADAGHTLAQFIQKQNEKNIQELGISFDEFLHEESFFENDSIEKTKKLLTEKKLIYENDRAIWLRTSKFGDTEDRVLIRSTGEPTYFLSDITHFLHTFRDKNFNTVIAVLGADHHGYAQRVKAALTALGIDETRTKIIITQLVRVTENGKEVRMSKRAGHFETLADFVNDVGIDVARFFFLEKSPDTHMDFDIGLAREHSAKNPVYYIQYAHARMSSILNEAASSKDADLSLLSEKEELALIKKMAQFPDIIEDTASDFQVHRIPRYAYELAHAFHDFYEKHRVIQEDKELEAARASLVQATRVVLQQTLKILGITAPEKM